MTDIIEQIKLWQDTDWNDGDDAVESAADLLWKAKAQIEELEQMLKNGDVAFKRQNSFWDQAIKERNEARDRIEELEARLAGVEAGTHVIVPVEPTETMLDDDTDIVVGCCVTYADDKIELWKEMIRAAQEKGE